MYSCSNVAFLNTLCHHHFKKQSSLYCSVLLNDDNVGPRTQAKMTCCEFHLGLNGHLPPGLAQRIVTVQIMSCARALISADRIN